MKQILDLLYENTWIWSSWTLCSVSKIKLWPCKMIGFKSQNGELTSKLRVLPIIPIKAYKTTLNHSFCGNPVSFFSPAKPRWFGRAKLRHRRELWRPSVQLFRTMGGDGRGSTTMTVGGVPEMVISQNGWFIMENPMFLWMMTGGTPILGTPFWKNNCGLWNDRRVRWCFKMFFCPSDSMWIKHVNAIKGKHCFYMVAKENK